MKRPIFDEAQKRITPQQFGALGDGKHDDTEALAAAIKQASQNGWVLELPAGEYYTREVVELDRITVLARDARISYYGLHKNSPAVNMLSYVNIFGKLTIWAIDNTKSGINNHGNRCGMAFGVYDSGAGAYHCYVEDITILTGGMPNANGVFITGDSSDITIGRVTVPEGSDVYRGVLVHWGNAKDHFPLGSTWSVENGYGHAENWKPTQHPHDLHFGVIDCSGIKDTGINDSRAAFHIAAGYDIDCEEVIMNDGFHAVVAWGADQGFEYAPPEVKALGGQRNIHIGKITGKRLHHAGLYVISYVLMDQSISVNTEMTVDEIDIEAAPDCKTAGMIFHSVESVKIGKATVRNYTAPALYLDKGNRLLTVDELHLIGCKSYALQALQYRDCAPPSREIVLGKVTATACNCPNTPMFGMKKADRLTVGTVKTETSAYRSVLEVHNGFERVEIGDIQAEGAIGEAVVIAAEAIDHHKTIAFGTISCGDIPLKAGSIGNITFGK